MIAHLLQSTCFAFAAMLLAYALRRNHASARFWIWFAASLKFAIPFSLLTSLGHRIDAPQVVAAAAALPGNIVQFATASTTLETSSLTRFGDETIWPYILFGVWASGVVLLVLRWALQWNRLRISAAAARPLNINAPIPVRATQDRMEPGVFGIVRPVLLLPQGLAEQLAPEQLRAVLTHELCHVRRRDNLTAAVHTLVQTAFWFHPLVWWIGARLVAEREAACDEEVLRLGNEPAAYAQGILNVCKICLEAPLPCVAGVTGADLKKRIEAIMTERLSLQLSTARKFVLAGAGLVALTSPLVIGLLHPARSNAQVPADTSVNAQFEVASIKPSAPDQHGMSIMIEPGGVFRATNATAQEIVAMAYNVRDFQIAGAPAWFKSDHFDITAKPPAGSAEEEEESRKMTPQQRKEMEDTFKARIRALFADRFQLVVKQETKEMPVYALVVGKGGSKLKASEGDGTGNRGIRTQRGVMNGMQAPVKFLADSLANIVGKPVIDQTGLTGTYDWKLEWTPDQAQLEPGAKNQPESSAPPELSGPSIFTAVQEQLGLKLESTKGSAPLLVIQRVEKPSAN